MLIRHVIVMASVNVVCLNKRRKIVRKNIAAHSEEITCVPFLSISCVPFSV